MNVIKYIGLLFLALWLIMQGLKGFYTFTIPGEEKFLPIINLLAGLILAGYCIKLKHGDLGLFLLGCWAVLNSTLFLFHFNFPYSNAITQLFGIAAGVALILKR